MPFVGYAKEVSASQSGLDQHSLHYPVFQIAANSTFYFYENQVMKKQVVELISPSIPSQWFSTFSGPPCHSHEYHMPICDIPPWA